ncbi:MAG TPA: hypothetical protein PK950_03395 [Candidatus Paceibacterota bacterium]|nr:hypothetical protein [Candidatus Paceibacterota bacterium]
MKYRVKGFINKGGDEIKEEVTLPSNEELAKSLLSPAKQPHLVTIIVEGQASLVKIAKMERDPYYKEQLVIYGYIQKAANERVYVANANWFRISENS